MGTKAAPRSVPSPHLPAVPCEPEPERPAPPRPAPAQPRAVHAPPPEQDALHVGRRVVRGRGPDPQVLTGETGQRDVAPISVQAENHDRVVVRHRKVAGRVVRSRVGGSIQLKQGGGGRLLRTTVNGDIQLFSNNGRFEVRRNRVDGNLQCKSNNPRPVGGNNVVEGNKEDQCSRL